MEINLIYILKSVVVPILVATFTAVSINVINRKKRKAELEKLNSEIDVLKHRFQPVVISTLIKTHELLIEDKISALREILAFKNSILEINISYYEGRVNIEDTYDYYYAIYRNVSKSALDDFDGIINKFGYLFRDKVVKTMHALISDLSNIYYIQEENDSLKKPDMPGSAEKLVSALPKKFEGIIESIREDLHINDDFVHDFISNYKTLLNSNTDN